MAKLMRIAVIGLLAVFAVNSVVNTATATTMTLKMAMAVDGEMDMVDCFGSSDPDGVGDVTCDTVCIAPLLAALGEGSGPDIQLQPALPIHAEVVPGVGRTGSPDPFPPRVFI